MASPADTLRKEGRQSCEPGEYLTAPQAARQVILHQGALGRLDRAQQIHAKLLAGLRALAVAVHARHPDVRG